MIKKHYTEVCSYPWDTLMFNYDGSFGICCGGPNFFFCKISSLKEIEYAWNKLEIQNIRRSLLYRDLNNHCKDCAMFKKYYDNEYVNIEEGKSICRQGCNRPKNVAIRYHVKPKHLQVNITNKCNLRCIMCGAEKGSDEISLELFDEISKWYLPYSETFSNTINGEPFAHSNFNGILDIMEKYKPKNAFTLSNGSLSVNEEIWEKFIRTHRSIHFSVDAATKDTHKSIRGFDMEKLFKNINIIKEIKSSEKYKNKDFFIGFNFVIMKRNVKEMFEFVRLVFEEWGGRVVEMHHVGGMEEESVFNSTEHVYLYNCQLKMIKDCYGDKEITSPSFIENK